MRIRYLNIVAVLMFSALSSLFAQESDLLGSFDNLNMGPALTKPFLKNGFNAPNPWFGAEVLVGPMHFSYFQGEYIKEGSISEEPNPNGFIFQGGLTIPFIPWLEEGKFSFETIRLVPFIDSGFSYAEIGEDGIEDKAFSWGLLIGPGIRLRVPFIFFDVRSNAQLLFNNAPIFEKDNINAFSGLVFAPSITIGIDGLYELLSPAHFQKTFSEWVTKSEVLESDSHIFRDFTDIDGDGDRLEFYEYTTATVRTWQEREYTTLQYTLGPSFWGIGVKSVLHPGSLERGYSAMAGPVLNGRFGPLAIDAYYQYGVLGKLGQESFQLNSPAGDTSNILGVSLGFDIIKAGMPASMRPDEGNDLFSQYVSMLRILGRGSYQIISDSANLENNILSGAGLGIGFELGAAAMSWDYFWYPEQPENNTANFSFTVLAPWPRIFEAIKSRSSSEE